MINLEFWKVGSEMEWTGRIVKCVYVLFLLYDVSTIDGKLTDKKGKTLNTKRLLDLYKNYDLNENIIKKHTLTGRRMIRCIDAFGWSILFWDDFSVNKMIHKNDSDLDAFLKISGSNSAFLEKIDTRISRDEAKLKIANLVGILFGNVEVVSEIIEKIDTIRGSFPRKHM